MSSSYPQHVSSCKMCKHTRSNVQTHSLAEQKKKDTCVSTLLHFVRSEPFIFRIQVFVHRPLPFAAPLGAVLLATTSMADTHDAPVDGGAAPLSDEVETNWDESTPSFDLMDLKEELLRVRSFFFLSPLSILFSLRLSFA